MGVQGDTERGEGGGGGGEQRVHAKVSNFLTRERIGA